MGKLIDLVKGKFPEIVTSSHQQHGDETVMVKRKNIVEVMRWLRDNEETAFNMIMDLTAVDNYGKKPRFEVVYHLYSVSKNHRLRVKAEVPADDPKINSLVPVWVGADWYEREVWDMYGIRFSGHPSLKRLLLYEEFKGHPLRKDYPIKKRQPLIGPDN